MNNQISYTLFKKKSFAFLFVFVMASAFSVHAQKNAEFQINAVFNQLVAAYGSAKSAPQLVVLKDKPKQKTPAFYQASPKPVVKVDVYLYSLCRTFGKDSLNALSVVISHELAHYYNDHTFCSDFAFAIRKDNTTLSSKLKALKLERIGYETQADHTGLFYACIAGYQPLEVSSRLLDAIYVDYQLKDNEPGYPTKSERKVIVTTAQAKITELYQLFVQGNHELTNKEYSKATTDFEVLTQHFPSRENYNNLGVARTLEALQYQPLSRGASLYPERFVYPMANDTISRLQQASGERGFDEEHSELMRKLLKSAQKDFEKAISLDPDYTISYVNLACVFDLLDNPEAAIGKIKELPKAAQENKAAQRILAIAYYNADMEEKAEKIWKELEK
jgi:tetratricopeptide (TPR) repeat protein